MIKVKKRVQRFPKPPGYNERREGRPVDVEDEFENYGANAPSQPYPGRPQVYQDWDTYQRMMWDYNHYQWEEQRQRYREAEQRRAQFEERMEERMTQLEDNMMRVRQDGEIRGYYQQKYHHDLYDWTEQQRHWHDFTNQREYQQHVPRQDFASMMRHDGSGPSHPPPHFPEMNHPEWWPGDDRSHQGAGTSTSHHHPEVQDPFDTRDLTRSLHESMFGPDR